DAVRPQDRQPVAAPDLEVHAVQDLVLAVRLPDAADAQHVLSARPPRLEPERGIAPRAARQLHQLRRLLLDQLELALRLPRLARLRAEPVHELLVRRDLSPALLDLLLPPLP